MLEVLEKLIHGVVRPPCKCGRRMLPVRRGIPIFICPCGSMKIGTKTVTLDGALNKLVWTASGTPTVLGDLGMDVATGRPQAFVGGAAKALAVTTDIGTASLILGWGGSIGSLLVRSLIRWGIDTDVGVVLGSLNGIIEMTRAGTLRNLRIRHTSIPFATPYTVFKNGVATAIVATVPVSGVTGTDLVNTAAVLAGDTIEIQGDGVNGPLAATAVLQLD